MPRECHSACPCDLWRGNPHDRFSNGRGGQTQEQSGQERVVGAKHMSGGWNAGPIGGHVMKIRG